MKVKISKNYSETLNIPAPWCSSAISSGTLVLIFINNLPNDMKSEIEIFGDDVKVLVWSLSEEITQIDLIKLSYQKNIWK